MEKKIKAVYCIKNILTNDFYIGSTRNFKNRVRQHRFDLKHKKHYSKLLQKHFINQLESDFKFIILEEIENECNLLSREQFYLDSMNCSYNTAKIAGSNADLRKGIKLSDSHKKKISDGNKGKIVSQETRIKLSIALKGKIVSEESKNKMSESKKKLMTPERLQQMSLVAKGKPWTVARRLAYNLRFKKNEKTYTF
jgi:group I intron endonuclease